MTFYLGKSRLTSKTYWTFGVLALLSLAAMLFGWDTTPADLAGQADKIAVFVVSILALFLREKTDEPLKPLRGPNDIPGEDR